MTQFCFSVYPRCNQPFTVPGLDASLCAQNGWIFLLRGGSAAKSTASTATVSSLRVKVASPSEPVQTETATPPTEPRSLKPPAKPQGAKVAANGRPQLSLWESAE